MSAMDDMLANMVKKAMPKEIFEKIEAVSMDVSRFIVETRDQLNRIEAKLDRMENDNCDNSDGTLRIGSDPIGGGSSPSGDG